MTFCYDDVRQAAARIEGLVVRTPLEKAFYLSRLATANGTTEHSGQMSHRDEAEREGFPDSPKASEALPVELFHSALDCKEPIQVCQEECRNYYFKLESFQRTKSFKVRGALNKLLCLTPEEAARGIAAVSSGNHGSSVSYAASLLGIQNSCIIVPRSTPQSKIDKIRYFGAEVLLMGGNYDEAHALGMAYISERGLTNIDAYYNDPLVYAGQGTIALELLEQEPSIDTIVVPIGGGGLITGIGVAAKAVKPSVRVIGVQTEACPAFVRAMEEDVFYAEFPAQESLCDALVGGIGELSFQMARDYVDDIVLVSEESIAAAVSFMAKEEKYVLEGAACTTVAAVRDFPDRVGGKNIALVLSGANIEGSLLTELLARY